MEEVERAKNQAKKAKEEAEKAREEAQQEGYDIGVIETEEALRAQAESQRLLLRSAEDQLAASKEQITALKKKLEEVERAKNQAEKAKEEAEKAREEAQQEGYDIGVIKTKEALRAEVLGVCRIYCAQVWDEALNRAGVEASFVLRKAENVYYPPEIRAPFSSNSKIDALFEMADLEQHSPGKVPPPLGNLLEMVKQPKADEKGAEMTKEVTLDATMPPAAPQDPSKDEEDTIMEIALASLPIPAKGDSKGANQGSSEATAQQTKAPPPGKIIIKKK